MLSISILSLTCGSTLFSGDMFEDQIAILTWPCTLPPGWSVEWDLTPANDDNAEWCHVRDSSWHSVSSISWTHYIFHCKSELWYYFMFKFQVLCWNSNLICNISFMFIFRCKTKLCCTLLNFRTCWTTFMHFKLGL